MAQNVLALYNIALQALGERSLDSTAENRPVRRELDKIYAAGNGVLSYVMEQGDWNFATTRLTLGSSTGLTPAFQYAFGLPLPTDFVRLLELSTSTGMNDPLIEYDREGNYILSNSSLAYLRYVSDSTAYGGTLTNFPETLFSYLGHWLALQVYPTVKAPRVSYDEIQAKANALLISARQKNAAEQQMPFPEREFATVDHRQLDYALEMLPALMAVSGRQK